MPRAIMAAGDLGVPADLLNQLTNEVSGFKERYEDRFNNLEASVNEKIAGHFLNGGGGSSGGFRPEDPDYSRAFASYFRKGDTESEIKAANATGHRARIQAAMSVGTADQGGYLAPVEWDRRISQAQVATSPMRRLATVQNTTVGAYTTPWNNNVWGSGWVGETAARPQTTNATLFPVEFASGEIYAMPAITQRLLDDADFEVEDWLASQVETEFNRQEGIAFLAGDGVNKPRG